MKNPVNTGWKLHTFSFKKDGVEIRKALLPEETIELIKSDIDLDSPVLKKYGIRNLEKRFRSISNLATSKALLSLAKHRLNGDVSLVRALFFDKTPDKNWFVTWHQDKTVTLNKHIDAAGWGPWSIKDKVHHVQPPVSVLDKMITIRLHIDSADEDNGCLTVIPGSHQYGILEQTKIDELVSHRTAVPCTVNAGDAVIMRPLILHKSSKSNRPSHRRVVHLEFSSFKLPYGVTWA